MNGQRTTRRVKDRPRSSKLFGSRHTNFTTTSYTEDFDQKRLATAVAKPKCNKNALPPVDWEWPRIMSAYKRSVDALNRFYCRSTYQDTYSGKEGDLQRPKLMQLKVPGVSDPSKPQYSFNSTMRSSYPVLMRNDVLNVDLMRYGCYKDRKVPARGIVPSLFADSTGVLGNWHHKQKRRLFKLPSLTSKGHAITY